MDRFRSAMRKMRPEFITEESLRELFDEIEMAADPGAGVLVESEKENRKKEKKQRLKKRKAIPDHLPRTIVPHDLPEEEKSGLSPLGFDVKLELKYTRAKFEVLEHRYFKYAKKHSEGIVRCPPEPSIIPQSYASAELLGNIADSKFCDHIPLYRQEQIYFSRHGVYLTRQVMADWMIKLGEALNPLIGLMHVRIIELTIS